MALFGTGSAQFQKSGSSVVTLEYSITTPTYIIPDEIEHKSIINGYKNYITNGDYSAFRVGVNLYKYADPKVKFDEIYSYLHDDVYFWPHSDGIAVSGSDGEPVEFHITDMKLSYYENYTFKDFLEIEFEATNYTDMTKSLA